MIIITKETEMTEVLKFKLKFYSICEPNTFQKHSEKKLNKKKFQDSENSEEQYLATCKKNAAWSKFRTNNCNNGIYQAANSLLKLYPSILLRQKNVHGKAKGCLMKREA